MKKQNIKISIVALLVTSNLYTLNTQAKDSKKKEVKGLLNELKINSNNEELNDKKALGSEILITDAENKAINALRKLIHKKKGTAEEADLQYRLAELYMRRSKSGRFFDLERSKLTNKLSPFPIPVESGKEWIRQAITVYDLIENRFKDFYALDGVLFNNAFASQQLGMNAKAEITFKKLLNKFPNSRLVPDTVVALGELLYDQQNFKEALNYFNMLERFPDSSVYSYGMYKSAWTSYNLKNTKDGIDKLKKVLSLNPPLKEGETPTNKQNLRSEALRDLAIFAEDQFSADKIYSFFESLGTKDELNQTLMDMAKLYEGHSRYKDIIIFLNTLLSEDEYIPVRIHAYSYLINSSESLKQREDVLKYLSLASNDCATNSSWYKKQKPEDAAEQCSKYFKATSLEIAQKWWDIWLKNKQHKEFSSLTKRVLELVLKNDDPKNPDLKTRYAYAELLFQIPLYDEASIQYKIVGDQTTDKKIQHDADYAALFAKDKSIEKEKTPKKIAEQKELALNYVKKHPDGTYNLEVSFKIGILFYEEKNYTESQKWLKPIADNTKNKILKLKSEDILLDILNINKDYSGIKNLANQIALNTQDADRKSAILKIAEQAHYNEIQSQLDKMSPSKKASSLMEFANLHQDSPLAKDSQWQAIGIMFTNDNLYEGAENALKYAEKFKNEQRSVDALKEASKAYAKIGELKKSADILYDLASKDQKESQNYLETAAEFYGLEGQTEKSKKTYFSLLEKSKTAAQKTKYYSKLLEVVDKNSKDYETLKSKILAEGIEPYTTQFLSDKAKSLFEAKKDSEAFELAKKIINREVESEYRAPARLIQANILEKEFIQQSVKAKEDKLALVLSLKTEKLDKAHTAYFSTLKMTQNPKLQFQALSGIERIYTNYIDSISNMPMPTTLSEADQKALRSELAKLVNPIKDKKNENAKELALLATHNSNIVKLSQNLEPNPIALPTNFFPVFIAKDPYAAADDLKKIEKPSAQLCKKEGANIHEKFASCYEQKNTSGMHDIILQLIQSKETRPTGLYYQSLLAEQNKLFRKALWLVELAQKDQNESALFQYQKARLTYILDGFDTAIPIFEKVLKLKMSSTELKTLQAYLEYQQKNYTKSAELFSQLKIETLYNLNMAPIVSESLAQIGKIEESLNFINNWTDKKHEVDKLIQKARVLEVFKKSPEEAKGYYKKAADLSTNSELKELLNKKITTNQ